MSLIVLDEVGLKKLKFENKASLANELFPGDAEQNAKTGRMDSVAGRRMIATMDSQEYENSATHAKLWNTISDVRSKMLKNAAMLPDDILTLTDAIRLDITRRRLEEMDYTSLVNNEVMVPGAGPSVTLDEFLEWGAAMETIYGNNDPLPLVEHKTGATGSLVFDLYGVGDKTSLKEVIFSSLWDLERLNRAVARGYRAKRNDRNVLGQMVAKTTATGWQSTQQQAADATANATKEELMYNTINAAINKLIGLNDPQTGLPIAASSGLTLACNPKQMRAIERAIRGQLEVGGKGKPANFSALSEISQIVPYQGDTIYMGKKTYTYGGVDSGKAYLFVPRIAYTVVKRPLTMVMGEGDVLNLEQTKRAWYAVDKAYDTEFFGHSAGGTSGTGWCVEITLPSI